MYVYIVIGVIFRGGLWRSWPIRAFSSKELAIKYVETTEEAVSPDIQILEVEGW